MTTWRERLQAAGTLEHRTPGHATLICQDCRQAGRVSFQTITRSHWNGGRPSSRTTLLVEGAARETIPDLTRMNPVAWAISRPCPWCASPRVKVNVVKGQLVESKACDDRCMGATGPTCSCSCGGENHGGSHQAW